MCAKQLFEILPQLGRVESWCDKFENTLKRNELPAQLIPVNLLSTRGNHCQIVTSKIKEHDIVVV